MNLNKAEATLSLHWIWGLLFLILLLNGIARVHFLDVPLERDEGEYAYVGRLILQGIPPYAKAYTMKLPGIHLVYAGAMALFGESIRGIHLGLLLVNTGTLFLLFFLGRKLFNSTIALVASASFSLLSLSQCFLGFSASAEHFIIFLVLAGLLLLFHACEQEKKALFFLSGLLLGSALLVKQHALFFVLLGAGFLLYSRRPFSKFFLFSAGAFLPYLLTCLILWQYGVFKQFWFWTFTYARKYVQPQSLSQAFMAFKTTGLWILNSTGSFIIFAIIGLIIAFHHPHKKKSQVFIIFLLLFSFLAVCPKVVFRPQYFIFLIPAIALLNGIAFDGLQRYCRRYLSLVVLAVVFVYPVYRQWFYFFKASPADISALIYSTNPFYQSPAIAELIKKHTSTKDSVAILGSEPQIYFYAQRLSATGYIYTYGLMENHPYALQMQKEMIQEIEQTRPKILIFVNHPLSWLVRPNSHQLIFEWFEQYKKQYHLIGLLDILQPNRSILVMDEKVFQYKLQSNLWIAIFKRNDSSAN